MKNLILSLLISFSTLLPIAASAITYEVIGPCSEKPVFAGSFDLADLSTNAGKATVQIFDQHKIPYQGDENGFKSIIGTPTGTDSIEVISETKMRAYGWCYSIDGVEPDVMPKDVLFNSSDSKLIWFYAYSTYDNGSWIDYCVPSYRVKAAQFCSKK
ncbi:MAG: hypothetical protein WC635_15430 [Bacteriovorax sp.]|jgi:hypothetical protein